MENELELKDGEIATMNDSHIEQFKSLYYLLKGKRDTDIKLFNGVKQFSYDDIVELNNKMYKKLDIHRVVTDIVTVTVGLDNKEIISFGSWNEFVTYDWKISANTKYITLEWDFNIILPNQEHNVPQTHTVRVRIGNSLKPNEMIQVIFMGGEEYDFEEAAAQMSCKIDFVNTEISKDIKVVVSGWYDALTNNSEDHKLIKFILRNEAKLQHTIILSFIISSIILMNYLHFALNDWLLQFVNGDIEHRSFMFLTSSIAVLYLFYQSGRLFAERMAKKQIGKLVRNPIFEFTKGDENRMKEVSKENKKLIRRIGVTILLGLSVNGLSALIGTVINLFLN